MTTLELVLLWTAIAGWTYGIMMRILWGKMAKIAKTAIDDLKEFDARLNEMIKGGKSA